MDSQKIARTTTVRTQALTKARAAAADKAVAEAVEEDEQSSSTVQYVEQLK